MIICLAVSTLLWRVSDRRTDGRTCINNIWCKSVQALLRYRSKTAKMQKFPIDSHSNENFICPFFRPPGAANHQKRRRHVSTPRLRPHAKFGVNLPAGAEKSLTEQKNKQKTYSIINTSSIRGDESMFCCFYMCHFAMGLHIVIKQQFFTFIFY